MDRLVIRPSARADLSALDALYARAYPKLLRGFYPPSVLVTALPIISRVQPALVASGTYFVAELDGRIVGAGGWTPARPGSGRRDPGRGNIRHVVTDDRMVRRGIGRRLVTHVIADARAAGCSWLHCLSTRTAVPFYAALGFDRLGEVTVPLGGSVPFPAVEMRRDL